MTRGAMLHAAALVWLACADTAQAQTQASTDLRALESLEEMENLELTAEESDPVPDAAESGRDPRSRLTPQTIRELLARYAHEPKVAEVVQAALRAAGSDPDALKGVISRARLRGLLPHVDLGARRGQGIDLRWTPTEDLEAHRTTADDVTLFATLRFDLDRLLFTGEEVSLTREARAAQHAQQQLIRAVVRVYFLRRRLMLERDLRSGSSIAQQLRIEEAEALLDAFTNGAFQHMLKASKLKSWRTGASTNASVRP